MSYYNTNTNNTNTYNTNTNNTLEENNFYIFNDLYVVITIILVFGIIICCLCIKYINGCINKCINHTHNEPFYIENTISDIIIDDNSIQIDNSILISMLNNYNLNDDIEDICSICLEKFVKTNFITKLDCTHIYHHKCIFDWICENKYECPLCRRSIITPIGI